MYVPQQRFASIRTLVNSLNISREIAKQIRKLVGGEIHPDDCPCDLPDREYSFLPREEKILWAINTLLDQQGVEAFDNGSSDPRYFEAVPYVNNGQTYQPTILFHKGLFKVASWGSIVEQGGY